VPRASHIQIALSRSALVRVTLSMFLDVHGGRFSGLDGRRRALDFGTGFLAYKFAAAALMLARCWPN